jgi:hypothetical protein
LGRYEDALLYLEVVSSLIHDITSILYDHLHLDREVRPTDPPTRDKELVHRDYSSAIGLKHNAASIAGYWAETSIFGGPIMMARGSDENEVGNSLEFEE